MRNAVLFTFGILWTVGFVAWVILRAPSWLLEKAGYAMADLTGW